MKPSWLLPGLGAGLGALSLVVAQPAQAARLQSWWFDTQANRLMFTTDTGVQPRAQLIANPTRIVIDLPNTTLTSGSRRQVGSGAVREVRVGQFDRQTARIVIELAEGYTVNPSQVRVQGLLPTQWMLQLPTPVRQDTPAAAPIAGANQIQRQGSVSAPTQLEGIIATGDGFLIKLSGAFTAPDIRSEADGSLRLRLPNTGIVDILAADALPNNRYSVTAWELSQNSDPPSTDITLRLAPGSPGWRVLPNQLGLILLPPSGVPIGSIPDLPPAAVAVQPPTSPGSTAIPVPPPQTAPALPPPGTAQLPPPTRQADERIVVVLDPGHGGRDPGAVGRGGLQEKQVIFPITLRVRELLEAQGVSVVLTRYDDRTLDLQPRVDIAERANGDLFVSIHANAISLSRPDVNGIESYYASAAGQRLAAVIHASMLAATGMNDRGVRQARFYVIRHTSMPATLLEVGFVTGERDAPRLADPAWRETMAVAIANGILQYIQQTF